MSDYSIIMVLISIVVNVFFIYVFFKMSYDIRVNRRILEKNFGKLSKKELKILSFLDPRYPDQMEKKSHLDSDE